MHLNCLSSPHLKPHSMGRLHSTHPRQDCLSSFVYPAEFSQTPPASPAALTLLCMTVPGNQLFSPKQQDKALLMFASALMFPGFFCMRRVSQSTPSSSLDRKHQRRHWLCHLTNSHVKHLVTQQNSVPPMACVIPQQLARQLLYCISYHFCFMLPLISE